jgi:hypothetical protein
MGSLSYFFSLMEKTRLGNDHPDYHTLLAALSQILDGLLLSAWRRECGSVSLKAFAESKPTAQQLRDIAAKILDEYATPFTAPETEPDSMIGVLHSSVHSSVSFNAEATSPTVFMRSG